MTTIGSIPVEIQQENEKVSINTLYNELFSKPESSKMLQDASTSSYPNWEVPDSPLSTHQVSVIFKDYQSVFGFQKDNVKNMQDHLLVMLNSRAARMTPRLALWTLHADYIGGEHANYRKWYFVAQLDLDDKHSFNAKAQKTLEENKTKWRANMEKLSDYERVEQLTLYLLIWGEASTLRYTPELLCFIYYVAEMYKRGGSKTKSANFLDSVISPLYRYIRDQSYQVVRGHYIRHERDHSKTVGYDDINQLFWSRKSINKIQLKNNRGFLKDIPPEKQYLELEDVDWEKTFSKTFYESRSWFHTITNFSRVWIIHASSFWYYIAADAEFFYTDSIGGIKTVNLPKKLSFIGLGGLIAVLLMIIATVAEYYYVRRSNSSARLLTLRLAFLLVITTCHVAMSVYIFRFDQTSKIATIVSSVQLGVGGLISIVLAIVPPSNLFHRKKSSQHLTCRTFTSNFSSMSSGDRLLSILLWLCIFTSKFLETYFLLAMSFRDSLLSVINMNLNNCSMDPWIGQQVCRIMPILATVMLLFVEFVLFFLDTYLWYIVWSTIFSVILSFRLGISMTTSRRVMFSKVPRNMFSKITAVGSNVSVYLRQLACSQVWNAIVMSMHNDHRLSLENLQSLLYTMKVKMDENGEEVREMQAPNIFDINSNHKLKEFFPKQSEAERRLSFFAQSLTTQIPMPCSVKSMPTFTVFTPHYGEKIILSLREIIREEDSTTRVTLLEYLKRLHPGEWENFVKDTKFILDESDMLIKPQSKDDLPFYCIGFKSSAPESTLRTRLWASVRAQTLYRTIDGFMNYSRALKTLYHVETSEFQDGEEGTEPKSRKIEEEVEKITNEKFKYLVAMQLYSRFSEEDIANCEYLLTEFPNLQIAYIEEEATANEDEPFTFYSVLIDGYCKKLENGRRTPKYRIKLPGNPILGDGKSDNQNHALIFYRGEYLQLVDANQDNYLEECIKIRSLFGEFEQEGLALDEGRVYALYSNSKDVSPPVAIVGAREYIFSENVGMLGDVAAGKERTFSTLTQRIMAKIGSRLHYGHPDFLNAVFMTTRGGVSKAQRGLHLNEDIYAGMNALLRGGRIKHTEYMQCGKGRDLGFCSILNFTTKIGAGMGEQLLSREYYYLGTQLPLDRLLTFYYAHPGFHINNIMIIFAVQMLLLCMTVIGTMRSSLPICRNDDCFFFYPFNEWLYRCIISIFIVFFVSFLPLVLQELTERGPVRSIGRLLKQLASFSFLFEVFITQIYSYSILSNLSFGGARYISTGRGFATSRLPFSVLYSRFANSSIYFGARTMFMLLFTLLSLSIPHLAYFWITVAALVISPFLFNPHQFVLTNFIYDYREFLGWLSRGNSTRHHEHSWINFLFSFQRFIFKIFMTLFMTRELHHDATNRAWWSGKWKESNVGVLFSIYISPREYFCKIFEMSIFTIDFILGHMILFVLFPFTLVPYIDRLHSLLLFWIRPSKQIRPSVLTTKEKRQRRLVALTYGPFFIFILVWFVSLVLVPPYLAALMSPQYEYVVKVITDFM
ncbi:glycosyltransferase family 48 protein [Backusella circina FSU 941]|nr:glycosyltransferase family 48 protein [Backusella circina FSU 941]